MRRSRHVVRAGVVVGAVAVLGLAYAAGGGGDDESCRLTLDPTCEAQRLADAPDPGGTERRQPVPPRDKAWGFNLGVWAPGDTGPEPGVRALRRVGATHYRFDLHWNGSTGTPTPAEPVPRDLRTPLGKAAGANLRRVDRLYAALVEGRITPVIILLDAPRWASTLRMCAAPEHAAANPQRCPPNWLAGNHLPDDEFLDGFAAWGRAIADRYPRAVIEGPNEPDRIFAQNARAPGSAPTAMPAEHLARIQCALDEALPERRTLLSSALTDGGYIREFLKAADGCFDVFSFHPYPGGDDLGDGSVFAQRWAGLREARLVVGDQSPIWVTETGVTVDVRNGQRPDADRERKVADLARRLYNRITTMDDVQGLLFHTLRDAPGSAHTDPSNPEYHFGFFDTRWNPKRRACSFLLRRPPGCGAS